MAGYRVRLLSTIGGVLLLGVLALAAWRSVLLARADAAFRTGTPEGVARAAELAPADTDYLAFAALQAEYAGQDPAPLLTRMAEISPVSSAPRIRLGLAAELRGDPAEAERWLLDAYRVDHQFETRWTLANFYLRQNREDDFWTWMRSALEMSYGDRRPAFGLCWRMSADPAMIAERAIPDRPEVLAAYVSYLLESGRANAAAPVALRLAAADGSTYRDLLNATVDALIDAGRTDEAVELWQATGNAAPAGITNPDFVQPPVEHGFGWRLSRPDGVTHLDLDAPPGHRIRFRGDQPEQCELLRQVVAGLRPGAAYELRWQARTQGIQAPSGIEWRIAGASAMVEPSEDGAEGTLRFTAPADSAVLALTYGRPSGEVRIEGSLDLRGVVLEMQ